MSRFIIATLILAALSSPAFSQVSVKDAWVRATVPQQKSSGAFMQISSPSDVRLVEVKSTAAGIVEIHEMKMEGDVMKMKAVSGIAIAAGNTIELKPGGYHVMLMDLKQQLKAGETVPITLVLEGKDKQRSTVEVNAPVRQLNAGSATSMHKH
jgi:copper(I)-binding protein